MDYSKSPIGSSPFIGNYSPEFEKEDLSLSDKDKKIPGVIKNVLDQKNKNGVMLKRKNIHSVNSNGIKNYISQINSHTIKSYVDNNVLTSCCNFIFQKKDLDLLEELIEKLRSLSCFNLYASCFQVFIDQPEFCDSTIEFENMEHDVNLSIIAISSGYYRKIKEESNLNPEELIKIPYRFSLSSFLTALSFCYGYPWHKFYKTIGLNDIEEIYNVAHYLDMPDLKRQLLDYLIPHLIKQDIFYKYFTQLDESKFDIYYPFLEEKVKQDEYQFLYPIVLNLFAIKKLSGINPPF